MFIFQIAGLFAFNTNQRGRTLLYADFFTRVCILIIIGIPANRYRCRLIYNVENCTVQHRYCYLKRFIPSSFVHCTQK